MEAYSTSVSSTTQGRKASNASDLLHSVRKPWRKPVAPLPPNPTRVYKVRPVEFKDVVQKLTGAPEFQPRRMQTVAPVLLDVSLGRADGLLPGRSVPAPAEASDAEEFSPSPSSNSLCSFLLLSPGRMSGFDQSTVL